MDGIKILFNVRNYNSGILKVNKLLDGPTGSGSGNVSTIYAEGYVGDSIKTILMLGTTQEHSTDSVMKIHHTKDKTVRLPVWYKPNGQLTLKRYKNEKGFPVWRIAGKVFLYFAVFNGPFIILWVIRRNLKKK
jgi:hypothetical protein